MKVSELIEKLNQYKSAIGDDEVSVVYDNGDCLTDEEYLEVNKIHESYYADLWKSVRNRIKGGNAMKFNKEFFKRWSTLANVIAMVCAAIITSLPSLELSAAQVGTVMLVMNVVIAICQAVKQEAK